MQTEIAIIELLNQGNKTVLWCTESPEQKVVHLPLIGTNRTQWIKLNKEIRKVPKATENDKKKDKLKADSVL